MTPEAETFLNVIDLFNMICHGNSKFKLIYFNEKTFTSKTNIILLF